MIGLDTNVLARYYIDDHTDVEAQRQRTIAQCLIDSGQTEIIAAFQHILSLTHVTIEDRTVFAQALTNYQLGLSFSDALHHASYAKCGGMASFDDRRFAHRVKVLKLLPPVFIPH